MCKVGGFNLQGFPITPVTCQTLIKSLIFLISVVRTSLAETCFLAEVFMNLHDSSIT